MKNLGINYIDKLRETIKNDVKQADIRTEAAEIFVSPTKNFRATATPVWSNQSNFGLTKIELYNESLNQEIFNFFINEEFFFHGWLKVANTEYLVCAEDMFGGQTVIDLSNNKMNSYSPAEDGFIWTDFHLSPDGKILATIGCFWACPHVIKLFDFTNPLILPLTEIAEIELLGSGEVIVGWVDNETLQMKGIKKERVSEYFEDGSMRMNTISETNVERQIKVTIQ